MCYLMIIYWGTKYLENFLSSMSNFKGFVFQIHFFDLLMNSMCGVCTYADI